MNRKNEVMSAFRAGFTLVEILVVVAIIGVLATLVVPKVGQYLRDADVMKAKSDVKALQNAAEVLYYNRYRKMPESLSKLVEDDGSDEGPIIEGGEDALLDPWGNPYRYEKKKTRAIVISNGPDGESGTEDDIRSDKVDRKNK